MDLELRWVADFLVVVEEGHYGRAAARRHLTSSALTKHIQHLERQIGVVLLDRGPTGVLGVTPAGTRFAAAAEPLLRQAQLAKEAARARPDRVLRLGTPAGVELTADERRAIQSYLCDHHPGVEVIFRRVPFPTLTRCLIDKDVDVLWTGAAVEHPAIESEPVAGLTRTGLVAQHHPLADASAIDVATFSDLPMVYNPAVPSEWMRPFYLADLRPDEDARLVKIPAMDYVSVLEQVDRGNAVTVTLGQVPPTARPRVHSVELIGLTPMMTHAAFRATDRRSTVRLLAEALRAVGPGARSSAVSSAPAHSDGLLRRPDAM